MLVSIIVTIKNEADTIRKLLDSLIIQEKPFEIIIVDANSDDGTKEIIQEYQKKYTEIKLYIKQGSRGNGRNYGVKKSEANYVAFTDGGCIADKNWLKEFRIELKKGYDIVAGKTVNIGGFKETQRVEIFIKDYDVTYPSCNILYKKDIFEKIRGFDETFITAEDIDLNLRAVKSDAKLSYTDKAIIYRTSAKNLFEFLKQSFWYGYGRKQLSNKHGKLWEDYSTKNIFKTQFNFKGILRLFFGFIGYLSCIIKI